MNSQTFSIGHNVTLRDENRNKLGYLLKIYCRTKVFIYRFPMNCVIIQLLSFFQKSVRSHDFKWFTNLQGNERALVRWYFTDADLEGEKQVCPHEVFATSYTGKVCRGLTILTNPGDLYFGCMTILLLVSVIL